MLNNISVDGDTCDNELSNLLKLKLPPFWTANPEIWFAQVEAQFSLARVTSEKTKYNILLSNLPAETITTIIDFIQNPPEEAPYSSLKKLLIERLSSSEEKRLDDLLSDTQIGDQRSSDFYRSLLNTELELV
nr:uncharacterized protein LOC111421064 [Onthophagus taurus]